MLQVRIEDILNGNKIPVIDVRSQNEHKQGHFPGAINIPLLDNEERHIIGTTYKQSGREAAVEQGFELVGHKFSAIIKNVKSRVDGRQVIVYCWRGGMRSNIVAWVLETAGYKVQLVKGGYKSFRGWVLDELKKDWPLVILGGKTGSGKTELLKNLSEKDPVIDLEELANHKGSAFGALGMDGQPTNEFFENKLAVELNSKQKGELIWVENESRTIGSVKIPDRFFEQMREASVVEIDVSIEKRVERILKEYGHFPVEILKETTGKVRKRLGDLRFRNALAHLDEGRLTDWTLMMLEYYDKFYTYGNEQRKSSKIFPVHLEDVATLKSIESVIAIKESMQNEKSNG